MKAREGQHTGVFNRRQNILIAAFPSSPIYPNLLTGVPDVPIPRFAYRPDLKLLECQQAASEQYTDIKQPPCL